MPVDLPSPAHPQKEWVLTGRFVLISLLAFFGVIFAVNATMMTLAITTFSGVDARNGYDTSQNYNKEIAFARKQAERGWQSAVTLDRVDGAGRAEITLRDASGAAVTGLQVSATLRHPTMRQKDHSIILKEAAPGVYQAREADLAAGAWDMNIVAHSGDERVFVSQGRIILK